MWLAPIRVLNVDDSEITWSCNIERCAVRVGKPRGDLSSSLGIFGRDGAHRHDEGAAKIVCRPGLPIGAKGGDVAAAFEVPKANAGVNKGFFKRKRTSQ